MFFVIQKLLVCLEMLGGFAAVFLLLSVSLATGENTQNTPPPYPDVPERSLIEFFDQLREQNMHSPRFPAESSRAFSFPSQ